MRVTTMMIAMAKRMVRMISTLASFHHGWSLHGLCTVQPPTGIDPWDGLHGTQIDVVWRLDKPNHPCKVFLHGCTVEYNRAAQCNAVFARLSCGLFVVCEGRVEGLFGASDRADFGGLDAPDHARSERAILVGRGPLDAFDTLVLERAW